MFFAGILIESLKIDRLEKRWASRCLFLLVFAISVCSNIWPMGDSDISRLEEWAQEFSGSALEAADSIVLPVITQANVIYIFFVFSIIMIYLLISILYSRIYIGEKSGQGIGKSIAAFFMRLPILLGFFLLVTIPGIVVTSIVPLIWLFIIPALYFSPVLISLEKKNPIDAISYSYRFTRGIKFAIFWNLLTLFCIYQVAELMFYQFLPVGSSAGVFLNGFCTAFFVIALGRMNGIVYDRIRIHPIKKQ